MTNNSPILQLGIRKRVIVFISTLLYYLREQAYCFVTYTVLKKIGDGRPTIKNKTNLEIVTSLPGSFPLRRKLT